MQRVVADDLEALLGTLPAHIAGPLRQQGDLSGLLEVVLDLGRPAEARYPGREVILSDREATEEDLQYVVSRISPFGGDNRAGIERTLHRISAIRNRSSRVVGLTLRVGRAVFGTIKVIEDLIQTGKSLLLLGRPGVGKTTMLREVARVLADDLGKRVVIVDTSNEIAGDGDIPHPAIGHARRMQVPTPTQQHAVMIEAVENHMPEVIIIDEIGTELEAAAARTIAERGVQLVGTAHGNTLENLIMNPTLSDLIGGVQTVTLGDEEARRRGTQKSILERKAPPTFNVVVEIQSWDRVAIHPDVAATVDAFLRGWSLPVEVRWLDEKGEVRSERGSLSPQRGPGRRARAAPGRKRLYSLGVSRSRLEETARRMSLSLALVEDPEEADLLLTTKRFYRAKPQAVREAEARGLPIYVLRSNTPSQLESFLGDFLGERRGEGVAQALREVEEAIGKVAAGESPVPLTPQKAYIRRLQHQLAEKYNLRSQSTGKEPERRVQIFKGEAG